MNWRKTFLPLVLAVFSTGLAQAASFDLGASQLPVVLVPGFNHATVPLPVTGTAGGFNYELIQVSSDAAWVTAQVDSANQRVVLNFNTAALTNSSYTATISATHGANTDTVFVNATLGVRNIFKLIDDPVRSRMYGIQMNGANRGAVAVIDPLTANPVSSVTVGNKPTGMAVSSDGNELFVVNAVDKTLSVVNLNTLSVTETILLPTFDTSDVAATTANINVGPGNILYYTDCAWAPLLRVFDRSTKQVLQSVSVDGPATGYGFGDFALNPAKTQLFGWAQYGSGAGWAGSYIGKFSVAANGTLTFVEKTNSNYPTTLSRDPLETPVLVSGDGAKLFVKQLMVSPATIGTIDRTFSGPVYSITPGGEIAVTNSAVFQVSTGNKVYDLPVATSIHAITSDYSRLVYYNTTAKTLTSVDLMTAIGPEVMGRSLAPADGSIVLPPSVLSWSPLPGAGTYRVFLGTSSAAVTAATTASPEYLGSTNLSDFTLTSTLAASTTYYWRVDAGVGGTFSPGQVYSFTVSPISSSLQKVETATVVGHANHQVSVALASATPGVSWTASASQSWVGFVSTTGSTPSSLEIVLNASNLAAGVHQAVVTLSGTGGALFTLPVKLTVEALAVTQIKADTASNKVYAISENTVVAGAKAYLLELDSSTEAITRVVQVGTSATDIAIHHGDNRIYVPNWMPGSLRALNKTTLALERTYAFSPFAGTGYGANDAYRVAAGAAGRIVVEEQDQWVDVSIFNTATGAELGTIGLREGGGAFDPTGRYYFHGENNSSGAEIYKLDVTGDVFTTLGQVRVSSYSYYGSRVVVVSQNGNGVFWNGSYFNSSLVEQWSMAAETYSTTPDARLAFGESKIFDTTTKQQVLAMPLTTRVSAYNSTSKKLVVQNGARIRFYPVSVPLSLPAPTLASGTLSQTSIVLNWNDDSLETGFTLQQRPAGSSTWTNASSVIAANQTTYTVSGLAAETNYEFRIKADAPTVSSNWSSVLTVQTLPPPPPTVTLSSANVSGASIVLSYSSTGTPTSISIERALSDQGPWTQLTSQAGSSTSYTDSAAQIGSTYYYRIKASRGAVDSAYSVVRSATVPAPTVSLVSLAIVSNAVQVTMSATNSPTSLVVERSSSESGPWVVLQTLAGSATICTDSSVDYSTTYYYRIKAVRGAYETSYTAASSITTPALQPPSAPSGFAPDTVSPVQISLRWNDVAGESGYQLDRRLISDLTWTPLAALPANSTSYADTMVITGSTYVYRLSAFNAAGNGTAVQSSPAAAINLQVVLADDFDPDIDSAVWANRSVASATQGAQGFNGTKALWFGHAGTRSAATVPVIISSGSQITFDLRAGNTAVDGSVWENSDSGEGIVLEYCVDGYTWNTVQAISTTFPAFSTWQLVSVTVPEAATSFTTQFRWRQQSHSGANQDTWAIDNVQIKSNGILSTAIVEQPQPELVMEKASASLSVKVNHSAVSYQWFKDGTAIPGASLRTLSIGSARPTNAGSYRCRISGAGSVLDSDEAVLGVIQSVGSGLPVRVPQGGNFSLSMRVYPASLASQLTYEWYRQAEGDLEGIGTTTGAATSNLKVTAATLQASGSYFCFVNYQDASTLEVGPYRVAILSAPTIDSIDDTSVVVGSTVIIPVMVSDLGAIVSVAGLPSGLRFDADTNSITGIPTVVKTSTVTVNARNAYGAAAPQTFTLTSLQFPGHLIGSYQGVIQEATDASTPHGGQIIFQVASTGATTLTVQVGPDVYRLKASVQVEASENATGLLRATFIKKDKTQQTLEVTLAASGPFTGNLQDSDGNVIADVTAAKNIWTKASPTALAGLYNVGLLPGSGAAHPDQPLGHGYLALTLTNVGTGRWAGRLADGTAVTGTTIIGEFGEIPVYQSLYSSKGATFGWLQCDDDGNATGQVRWGKDDLGSKSTSRSYKGGITPHLLDASGSRYIRPAAGTALLSNLADAPNNAALAFSEGLLPSEFEQVLSLTKTQTVVLPAGAGNPQTVKITILPATGLFTGSFILKDPNPASPSKMLSRTVNFAGCLIQGQDIGVGHFLLPELPTVGVKGSSLSNTDIWSGAVELRASSSN